MELLQTTLEISVTFLSPLNSFSFMVSKITRITLRPLIELWGTAVVFSGSNVLQLVVRING